MASDTGATANEPSQVAPAPEGTPRLVLLISIDQFGSAEFERLGPFFTAGLRSLIDSSVVFPYAQHDHARTETGPGHATISTGRYPRHHGVVSNWWVEPGDPEMLWASEDDEYDRSPRNLQTSTLGDWLKERYPGAKVFAASGKARAAVLLGGLRADTAFWYEGEVGSFETSDYYQTPEWFESFNEQRWLEKSHGELWEPMPLIPEAIEELGIASLDLGILRPSFPHVMGGLRPAAVETFFDDMLASPWQDEFLGRLAGRILEAEELGADDTPDLLAVSFSAPDYIGHRYGPHSREYVDTMLRLDQTIGRLIELVDGRVGFENTLVVVTSDHGVAEEPEIRQRRGEPAHRVSWEDVHCVQLAARQLAESHGVRRWLIAGSVLAPELPEATGLSREELEEQTAVQLEACPTVEEVWTRSELLAAQAAGVDRETDEELWLFANSYYPDRSPEFLIRFQEYLMRSRTSVTSHGTSYLYDRQVPALFRVPGVPAAQRDEPIATVDLAPTIGAILDIAVPADVDGRDVSALFAVAAPDQADASAAD